MKKLFVLSGLFSMLFLSSAFAAGDRQPLDGNGREMKQEWYGCTYKVITGTTPVLVSARPVFLDSMQVTLGAAGGYGVAIDSTVVTGVSTSTTGRYITSPVVTVGTATTGAFVVKYDRPILTTYGLVIVNSATDVVTSVCYRAKP